MKTKNKSVFLYTFVSALFLSILAVGTFVYAQETGIPEFTGEEIQMSVNTQNNGSNGNNDDKVIVCHYPEGNLANPQILKNQSWEGNNGHSNHEHDFIMNSESEDCPPIVVPNTPPVITLIGDAVINLFVGDVYSDQGATANDTEDGPLSPVTSGDTVNTATPGTYTIKYNVQDSKGASATEVTRTVIVSEVDGTYPYGQIITPVVNEVVNESYDLTAKYFDGDADNDDAVQWAVRKGTCAANTNTIFGNVDGFNNSFTWDGKDFSATLDFSAVEEGEYCFVFNPTDDGEVDVRETVTFLVQHDEIFACTIGQELIKNGSFEAPEVTDSNGWASIVDGTPGLEWLVDWVAPSTDASLELQAGVFGWLAADGEQYAELDSHPTTGSESAVSISQEFETEVGEDYTLSFAFAARPGTSDSDNILKVYWDGVLIDTLVDDGQTDTEINWDTHTYVVPANSDLTKFMLVDGGTENRLGTLVDDVSVMCGDFDDTNPQNTPPVITLIGDAVINLFVGDVYSDQGATANDTEDGPLSPVTSGDTVNTATPGTYTIKYNVQDSKGASATEVTRTVIVTVKNIDDGDDDNNQEEEEDRRSGRSGSRIKRPSISQGEVLGASTDSCGMYLNEYMKIGNNNSVEEVIKLQSFLNEQGLSVPVTGFFGQLTHSAVEAFQASKTGDILTPWKQFGFSGESTGYVYKTTRYTINNIVCPGSEAYPVLP